MKESVKGTIKVVVIMIILIVILAIAMSFTDNKKNYTAIDNKKEKVIETLSSERIDFINMLSDEGYLNFSDLQYEIIYIDPMLWNKIDIFEKQNMSHDLLLYDRKSKGNNNINSILIYNIRSGYQLARYSAITGLEVF